MRSPYLIDEPAVISFSGGRTSAYMLYRILDAHDGKLPDDVVVCFANTGREMPQTLDFVEYCSLKWDVHITWLELGEYEQVGTWASGPNAGQPRYKSSYKVVNYESASRNGEPFARLIEKRRYLPNIVSRFCTQELKIRRIVNFCEDAGLGRDCLNIVGIRADEPSRAAKMHNKVSEGHPCWCPLYADGVMKEDIHAFWTSQPFDLELPMNNGVTDWGNCDVCFLKGHRKKMAIIRERPDLADWWIDMEERIGSLTGSAGTFRNDQPSYRTMKTIATDQMSLFDFEDDETIPCFCGE